MTLNTQINPDGSIDFSPATKTINTLPLGVYTPKYSNTRGIYLTPSAPFQYLKEYYLLDDFEKFVLHSFNSGNKSEAVIYTGLKGCGKTKRAHKLALDSGLPIIHLSGGGDLSDILKASSWPDIRNSSTFNNVVVIIDEYEKYLSDDPAITLQLLEWLDGSCNNKQLFILIGNEKAKNKFSDPLNDRLSRILWKKNFTSLNESEVKKLVNQLSTRNDKEDLIETIFTIPVLSLDNALQIIKTTNLFPNSSSEEIINMLNIEFKLYETFYLCDEFNEEISCDSTSMSIKKNTVRFKVEEFYEYFTYNFKKKLAAINSDINPEERAYISKNLDELNLKIIDKNKASIKVPYFYTSLETEKVIESENPITLFLIKENFLSKSKAARSFISFT